MYQRILVPLDGSTLAEQVLPYVRLLGKGLQVPVELFRVFDPIPAEWADPDQGRYTDRIATAFRNQAEEYLHGALLSLEEDGITVEVAAREGDAAELIVDEAEKFPNTLIAMTTHGRSGIARWIMGSITDKVLRSTSSAMFIVRAADEGAEPSDRVNLQTAVVAVDGSQLSEQVLPHVSALANGLGLDVLLVRVVPAPEGFANIASYERLDLPYDLDISSYEDVNAQAENASLEYLQEVKGRLEQQGVASVEVRVIHGQPAAAIVDLARDTENNLVALTTHGRSGMGRWVLGSVADRLVRQGGDPVLLVRPSE